MVGVPVFNEGRYLRQTLAALQNQTCGEFAVLIADNASTDGSAQIAREICNGDRRFHFHQHASNIGGLNNFRFLHEATASPLFMWLGAHDLLDRQFIEMLVAAHDRRPELSLAYSLMRMIDESGKTECFLENIAPARMPSRPMARYLHAYRYVYGYEINHIIKRSAFQDFDFRRSISWDLIFLAHLAYRGPFECVSAHLYSIRNLHPRDNETPQETMERLTGRPGAIVDTSETVNHVSSDFTQLARGRFGWWFYRWLLRLVVVHRMGGGLGVFSRFLTATAQIRNRFRDPFRAPGTN